MQTVENPNFFTVPQLAQTVFEGNRANFFTIFSATLDDMVSKSFSLAVVVWSNFCDGWNALVDRRHKNAFVWTLSGFPKYVHKLWFRRREEKNSKISFWRWPEFIPYSAIERLSVSIWNGGRFAVSNKFENVRPQIVLGTCPKHVQNVSNTCPLRPL